MNTTALSEDQMVHLLRNALLVAGHELGPVGDHWPVINSTVHGVMAEWEDTQAKRNAFAEVKKYYEKIIDDMVAIRNTCPDDVKGEIDNTIVELRAIYRACFDPATSNHIDLDDPDTSEHILRAATIFDTLEEMP